MDDEEVPLAVPLDDELAGSSTEAKRSSTGVTVITGYLGAGKTTLVNYVLKAQHGKRIAVILNEFGEELGIERAMINQGQEGSLVEEWIDLPNGCVCCSVKHSLVQALEQLMERSDKFDHILLETTGLANPGTIASLLWLDDELESTVSLDSTITVVDAKNFRHQLYEQRESGQITEALLQIAFADVVIVNKVDALKVEGEETVSMIMEDIESKIRQINSMAKIVYSVRCKVPLDEILHRKAYDMKDPTNKNRLLALSSSDGSFHDDQVTTVCITAAGPAVLSKVNEWLEHLLWDKQGAEILRAKGVLNISDSDYSHMLQAVREVYEISAVQEWGVDEKRINKIVFIGKNLNKEHLEDSFKTSCLESLG